MIVYFDLDGTLLNTHDRHVRAHQEAALACGGKPLAEGHYWSCRRHGVAERDIALLTEPPLDPEEYLSRRRALLETPALLELDRLAEGAGSVLPALAGKGFELVLTTMRRNEKALAAQLDRLGLAPFLSRVLARGQREGGWTVKRDLIASDLDEHPGRAVLVGDTEGDILAGRTNHLPVFCLTTGSRAVARLVLYGPSRLIHSLDELPDLLADKANY